MYFRDLGTATQIATGEYVRAVGWLAQSVTYPRGTSDQRVVERIETCARLWEKSNVALGWPLLCGPHACELCGAFWAAGNFGVPGDGVLYVCPQMIAHYVRAHEYQPPLEFVDAVLVAPLAGTPEYDQAVAPFQARRCRQ
jgi:hypothetical protein